MYVCVYIYVCLCVCVSACMCVCMCVLYIYIIYSFIYFCIHTYIHTCVCVSGSLYDSLYDVGTLVQERVCVRGCCAWLRVGLNAGYAYFLLATKCTNVAYAYVIMFMCICAYLYVDRKPGSVGR